MPLIIFLKNHFMRAAIFIALLTTLSCTVRPPMKIAPESMRACSNCNYNKLIDTTTANEQTGICVMLQKAGWVYRANKYLLKQRNTITDEVIPRPGRAGGFTPRCDYYARSLFVDGEFALSLSDPFTTFQGDICSARPTVIIHRHEKDWTPKPNRNNKESNQRAYGEDYELALDPTAIFYIGDQNINYVGGNHVKQRLLGVKKIILKQCGKLPEKIRISGRWTVQPDKARNGYTLKGGNYKSQEIYGGTYYPNAPGIYVVHDDTEVADIFSDWAIAKKNAQVQAAYEAKLRAQRRAERAQEGALLLLFMGFGMHMASPCNDPNITDIQKKQHVCN